MTRTVDGRGTRLDPWAAETAEVRPPDRVVMLLEWLTRVGGGVNTVAKDQIDYLSRTRGLAVDVLAAGGDYEPQGGVTFTTFPDPGDLDSVEAVLRRHVVGPATEGQRIAVIIHNLLTVPYSPSLNQALRRVIADVERDRALADHVQFIAWTHDVFDVPHELVPGVTYLAISEERRATLAEYLHQPRPRIRVARNAVNLRRTLDLSPEADWLMNTLRLHDEPFVALYPVRLARNKNVEGAIAVVAAMNRLGRRTTLLVPGVTHEWQRDYYNQLRHLASMLGIPEKVVFLTDLAFEGQPLKVTDELIRDLYKLASFLLFTSRDEGFGLPLIEAAAWRLPAVVSPIASLMSICRGTGTLVVDTDHEAADQAARRIIEYLDGNPACRMQRRVSSLYNMAHQFEEMGWGLPARPHAPCRIGAQTTNYFPRRRIEDQFLDAVHNGMDAFEVFFDAQPERRLGFDPEDLKVDIRDWLRERAREQDVCLSVYARRHLPEAARRRTHWAECLTFAHDIAAALLVVDLPPPEAFPAGELDSFVADLRRLIDFAGPHHIRLAVENGSCTDAPGGHILTSAEQLNDLFVRLGRCGKMAGVSFNAGRANLLEDPAAYLRKIGPPVVHVKLSDNLGPGSGEMHLRLGEGTLPLVPILEGLDRREYHMMIILEYFYADLARDRAKVEAALHPDRPLAPTGECLP